MAYYNGFIGIDPTFEKDFMYIYVCEGKILDKGFFYDNIYKCASNEEREELDRYFGGMDTYYKSMQANKKVDDDIAKIINKYISIDSSYKKKIPVIFELKYDVDGNMYGREIETSRLFPVLKANNYNFTLSSETKSGYVDLDHGRMLFEDAFGGYLHNDTEFTFVTKRTYPQGSFVIRDKSSNVPYHVISKNIIVHKVCIYPNYLHTNLVRFDAPIIITNPATELEIDNYRYSKRGYKGNNEKNEIIDKSNMNVFAKKLSDLIKQSDKPKRNEILEAIDKIELLLNKIQNMNPSLYEKYNNKYQNVLNFNTNNNVILNYEARLNDFIKELEDIIKYLYSSEKFVNYLDLLIYKTINNHELRLVDINDITNKFYELIDTYSLDTIKSINNRLGFLYYFYLDKHKDEVDYLMNSSNYIKDNLNIIYVIINKLARENYIEGFYELNEINEGTLAKLIKDIKFVLKSKDEEIKIFTK